MSVTVRGLAEVEKAVAQVAGPKKALLQKATSAGAKAIKPFVVAAAPRGATGKLKRSVSARKAKRGLPAAVVSPRPKVAFYRHFVIRGTKPHGPRKARILRFEPGPIYARHVAGTPARPFVDEGYRAGEQAALRAIEKVIDDALGVTK